MKMAATYLRTILFLLIVTFSIAKNIHESGNAQNDKKLGQSSTTPAVADLGKKENPKEANQTNALEQSKCECGIFNTENPTETDEAILTQAIIDVKCDHSGEEDCAKLCSALAQAAKDKGPQVLCSALGHYKNLKASIHSRICGAKQWMFTGLTAPHYICCHENQVTSCSDKN